jgi:flagellar hook-associated protein 2
VNRHRAAPPPWPIPGKEVIMASGTSSVSGLVSGIDWETTIQQLMAIERRRSTMLQSNKSDGQTKLRLWDQIQSKVATLQTAMEGLDQRSEFSVKTGSSSDPTIVAVTAAADAAEGAHTVQVRQLARAHRMAAQGWTDKNLTGVGDSGGNLVLKSGDDTITIADADLSAATTLDQLAQLINSSPDNDNLITASIVDDGSGSNRYRLVLTADRTGLDNRVVVSSNPTNLDFSATHIDSAELQSGWSGTSAVSTAGTYSGSVNKTFTFSVAGSGTQTVGGADITLNWADSLGHTGSVVVPNGYDGSNIAVSEGVNLSFAAGDLVGGQSFNVDVFTPELTSAQDALLCVDGIYLSKSSNSVNDILGGVTLDLRSADPTSTVEISIANDKATVKDKIQNFVEAYNSAMSDLNTFSSYDEENKVAAPLLGDSFLATTRSRLTNAITRALGGMTTGSRFDNLASVGITSSTGGQLAINSDKLDAALDDHFEDVVKLFTSDFEAGDSKVTLVSSAAQTVPGNYALDITYDATGAITAASINGQAATIDGTMIKGADNTPLQGLVLSFANPGSGPGTLSTSIRFAKGMAGTLASEAALINDDQMGPVHFARDNINSSIKSLDSQIAAWDVRLQATEDSLRRQYTNLETIISKMKNQSSYLSAAL